MTLYYPHRAYFAVPRAPMLSPCYSRAIPRSPCRPVFPGFHAPFRAVPGRTRAEKLIVPLQHVMQVPLLDPSLCTTTDEPCDYKFVFSVYSPPPDCY
jgi:hypothetical protein